MLRRTLLLLSAFVVAAPARADVRLHPLFTDHMVLQRDVLLPVWGTARPGEGITVTLNNQSDRVTADADGRWKATLPPMSAGGPFTLTIAGPNNTTQLTDVLVGEVWVCSGQSNMEWSLRQIGAKETIAESANPKIRLYTVQRNPTGEPQATCQGSWSVCGPASTPNFSAVGYYFGRDLQKALNVPVGLIHTSWGGTPAQAWTSREKLNSVESLRYYADEFDRGVKAFDPDRAAADYRAALVQYQEALDRFKKEAVAAKAEGKDMPKAPARPRGPAQSPAKNAFAATTLYNGMIAPLLPFPIAGATWYQGESNTGKAYEYRTLLPAMIEDWRSRWDRQFPFLVVQLAPFGNSDSNGLTYAELREAQLMTAQKTPKVGLAVITDAGDEKDIHPVKKEPVGQRLALLARAMAYGEKIVANGPMYKSMRVEGNKAVLTFDHVGGGLECRGDKLIGFEMCGEERKFHAADATIQGDTVIVSCDKVPTPEAVRFGFRNYVAGLNLFNKDGLPATPFRTDSYPGVTETAGRR